MQKIFFIYINKFEMFGISSGMASHIIYILTGTKFESRTFQIGAGAASGSCLDLHLLFLGIYGDTASRWEKMALVLP
jgi:hypothetical protein